MLIIAFVRRMKINIKKFLLVLTIFLLLIILRGCVKWITLLGCTGGIDGHTTHLSDAEKEHCIETFPDHDFNYKKR